MVVNGILKHCRRFCFLHRIADSQALRLFFFGHGEIGRYFNYADALGNSSDGGLDFGKYVANNSAVFSLSQKMHSALNGNNATNKFLVVDAGSLFLLQYNRLADPFVAMNDDALMLGTIIDPVSGIEFNYKVIRSCTEKNYGYCFKRV
jgi:hypothetical protein